MERGRGVDFSSDGTRLRWLEHTALAGGAGDMLSMAAADLPKEPNVTPLLLAKNAKQYADLGKGHVLVAANQAFLGTQNRVILVDEPNQVAYWVADSASRFEFLYGTTDLLIGVVTGVAGTNWVRIPLPQLPSASDAGTD